jgi:hypothetical protein
MGDERDDLDTALDGGSQRLLEFIEVESEDDDVQVVFGASDGGQQRSDALVGLRD